MLVRTMMVALAVFLVACGGEAVPSEDEGEQAPAEVMDEAPEPTEEVEGAEAQEEAPSEVDAPEEPEQGMGFDPMLLEGLEYSVVAEDTVPGIKRSLDVRLEARVNEDVLEALAYRLRAEDPASYERTFIAYYLPDMEVGAGAWATSHFDPDLEINFIGTTADEYEAILVEEVEAGDRDIVGRWLNDDLMEERILIFREDGKTFVEFSYSDGSSRVTEYTETSESNGTRFEVVGGSDVGDHYLLTSSGDLELRDSLGLIRTLSRLDE